MPEGKEGIPDSTIQEHPDELVFAFAYAVGTASDPVLDSFENALSQFGYEIVRIKLSDLFQREGEALGLDLELKDEPYFDRIFTRMEAGNRLCEYAQRPDFNALVGVDEINRLRRSKGGGASEPRNRTAYLVSSLKRPEEVDLMRDVYGVGFFLVGIYAPEQERLMSLVGKSGISDETKARELILKDQTEKNKFGQNTRDTFALADLFLSQNISECRQHVDRFADLIFANPFITPTQDEQNMFIAYSSSLRSGDLSRQVGASLTTPDGDVLAVGCNDVPKFGGGLYWPGVNDQRDHVRGFDSNEKRRDEIIRELLPLIRTEEEMTLERFREILLAVKSEANADRIQAVVNDEDACRKLAALFRKYKEPDLQSAKDLLKDTSLFSLTEFGRTVHAEMDALLSCARSGRSPAGATLYATTFPCHNCARHLLAAGVARIVYIEPYPKSLAVRLHYDAIELGEKGLDHSAIGCRSRLSFEPFLGLGPRRYFDMFSLKLSSGRKLERKEKRGNGEAVRWIRSPDQRPRVPMDPKSYLERENIAVQTISDLVSRNNIG